MPGAIQFQIHCETTQVEERLSELSELLQRLPECVADGIRKRFANLPDQLVEFGLSEGFRATDAGGGDIRVCRVRLVSPILDELCATARGALDTNGS